MPSTLEFRLNGHLDRALAHCLEAQDDRGAWQSQPDPRLFDTGLVAYALQQANDPEAAYAVNRARSWMKEATSQSHEHLARTLDEAPRLILEGSHRDMDLSDPDFYSEVFCRKALLLYALGLHAGLTVRSPFSEEEVRRQIEQYFQQRERIQIKLWNKIDLISVCVLMDARQPDRSAALDAALQLETFISPDGSFCYNPISTAMAFLALSTVRRGSPVWERCRQYLLSTQQADGTWRFCISDVWDTALTVRMFRRHPMFRSVALKRAVQFLLRRQNPDGGWGFRSDLESDNDTTPCVLLSLQRVPLEASSLRRALDYLGRLQTRDGLWRTWQAGNDPPVEDAVAHVVTALKAYKGRHHISTVEACRWLVNQYQVQGLWMAGWYRNTPYAILEVGRALGNRHPATQAASHALLDLQNPDGGWGGVPGSVSMASATGLALTTLLQSHDLNEPFIRRGLGFLMDSQRADGTWTGQPELYGPRPLLYHLPSNTHAFATSGLLAAWCRQRGQRGPAP